MTTAVRSIPAQGLLKYSDRSKEVACSGTLTVHHDGDVELACATPPSAEMFAEWALGLFGPMPVPSSFEGSTATGENLLVTGPFLAYPGGWSASSGARARFVLTGPACAEIQSGLVASGVEWRFGVVNFAWKDRFVRAGGAPQVMFQLGDLSVLLKSVSDNQTSRLLSSGSRVALTSELCLPSHLDRVVAEGLASDLCAILSLADGTLINWIYVEQRKGDGTRGAGFYHPAVTRRYNGALPLIDPNEDGELVAFVENAYQPYGSKKHGYSLATIARAIPDVRTDGFLETRCLQLLSLIECIVSRDAAIHNSAHVLDEELFEARLAALSSQIRAVLSSTFPEASSSDLDAMCGHLRGFNYPSFGKSLLATAKRLGSSIEKTEVRRLSETRNDLVHRGRFSTDTPFEEVRVVMSVLDRLVMGLLEYAGPHIDARTFKRVLSSSQQKT